MGVLSGLRADFEATNCHLFSRSRESVAIHTQSGSQKFSLPLTTIWKKN